MRALVNVHITRESSRRSGFPTTGAKRSIISTRVKIEMVASERCDPFSQEMKNIGWDGQKIRMSNKTTTLLVLQFAGID